ncbi:MAG: DUF1294 domain-containing protein [Chloroflexota bacterium]
MPDQNLTCVNCGRRFPWTEGEQRFYAERGLSAPKRCPICRSERAEGAAQGDPAPTVPAPRRRSAWGHPTVLYGLLAVGLALVASALLIWQLEAIRPWVAWLIAVSLITFLVFGYDKLMARLGRGRVPEAVLLGLAAIGGSLGALAAMPVWRHKTAKQSFRVAFWAIVVVQLVALGVYVGLRL